jgi:hypothetical protein
MAALFERRFNRLEFYSAPLLVWTAFTMQSPWPFLAAVPLTLLSAWGERRLAAQPL